MFTPQQRDETQRNDDDDDDDDDIERDASHHARREDKDLACGDAWHGGKDSSTKNFCREEQQQHL